MRAFRASPSPVRPEGKGRAFKASPSPVRPEGKGKGKLKGKKKDPSKPLWMQKMSQKKALAKDNPVQVDARSWVKPQHRKRNTPEAKARHYAKQKERRKKRGEEWLAKKRAKDAERRERRARGEPPRPPLVSLRPNPDRPAQFGGTVPARVASKPKVEARLQNRSTAKLEPRRQQPVLRAAGAASASAAPDTPPRDESLPPLKRRRTGDSASAGSSSAAAKAPFPAEVHAHGKMTHQVFGDDDSESDEEVGLRSTRPKAQPRGSVGLSIKRRTTVAASAPAVRKPLKPKPTTNNTAVPPWRLGRKQEQRRPEKAKSEVEDVLGLFSEVEYGQLFSMQPQKGNDWQRVDVGIDSCAATSCIDKDALPNWPLLKAKGPSTYTSAAKSTTEVLGAKRP
eukprot:846705-Karenia_brevis.AAC.1